jgi:hypothetical protein
VLLKFLSIVCVKFSKMRSGKGWRKGKAHSFGQPPKVEVAFFVRAGRPSCLAGLNPHTDLTLASSQLPTRLGATSRLPGGRFCGVGGAPFFGGRAYWYCPEQERDRFGVVEVLKTVFREDHFTAVRIEGQANFTRAQLQGLGDPLTI